jgi:hypothetical protein
MLILYVASLNLVNYATKWVFMLCQLSSPFDWLTLVSSDAYEAAILSNSHLFRGKVVLVVGAGIGLTALWAARAGARLGRGISFHRYLRGIFQLYLYNPTWQTMLSAFLAASFYTCKIYC